MNADLFKISYNYFEVKDSAIRDRVVYRKPYDLFLKMGEDELYNFISDNDIYLELFFDHISYSFSIIKIDPISIEAKSKTVSLINKVNDLAVLIQEKL